MIERKLLLVDLREASDQQSRKSCPLCGSAGAPVVTPTIHDYVARAAGKRQQIEREGWTLDLTHADTKRFDDTMWSREPVGDINFVVAVFRNAQ